MKIIVAGGTGFIGQALVRALSGAGHSVDVLTRSSRPSSGGVRALTWGPGGPGAWRAALAGADAVVNLAGATIAGRWTEPVKQRILESRVESTRAIVSALREDAQRPRLLVNASAVGYYGPRELPAAEDAPAGEDFLARVCVAWEAEAREAEALGMRVVRLRFGVVLGREGGALAQMRAPFRLGLGGRLGSGTQPMSWIHLDDACALARLALERPELSGPVNAVAPQSVTNAQFTKTLGAVLHRPALLPVPAFALRLLLGEMAQMLLTGQKVLPKKALEAGYRFKFPELKGALADLLSA